MHKSTLALFFIPFVLILQCKEKDSPEPIKPSATIPHADDYPTVDNSKPMVTIEWDDSATKLSHDVPYAEYGRIQRVLGDTLLLTYHCGDLNNYWDNVAIRRSIDNGKTWSDAEILIADNDPNYWGFANPQILTLKNGDVMLACTGRGRPDDNSHDNIQIRISHDRGWTFGTMKIVASGRSWEPGMIQLDDGEIELFYSSEAAWWPSNDVQQEILMVKSFDNGAMWKSPQHVAYTSGMRDGMPIPLILKDNKGIVFPIESINNSKSPWIVWSSMDARWNYKTFGTLVNGRRWLASADNVWGGAPYIVQLSTKETLLSFQDFGGRAITDWKKSIMLVLVGNSQAQNFTNATSPWANLPLNEGAYYSSMFMKDDNTVVLVTTRNMADNHSEIYWKEGHIKRD